ncbi:hypothetical protein [Deinococcus knuensis]|uniref:Uncharacterized protein n=1 Tax=Deinococcus knuensis TaxID=1837380 RepID=A0ABQ2SD16_9DEIO|nr:hypothetical protein [Deinococcus knuensis]GGS13744.1 hypothetical protein GCM10008961_01160 [Deinococcus knuensis]
MKKNLLTLTALLLANAVATRGEGENNPGTGSGNDGRLSEAEWRAKLATEHAQTSHADLVSKLAAANRKIDTLTVGQVPQGGRALTADEAKAYDAFIALGTPDEVKTRLDQGTKDSAELTDLRFKDTLHTAARDAGYKPRLLGDRVKADGLTLLPSREVERDGKKMQVAYVKDAQGAEHELATYARQHWEDYLVALQAEGGSGNAGASYARQDAGSGSGSGTGSNAGGSGGSWLTDILKPGEGGGYVDPLQPAAAK